MLAIVLRIAHNRLNFSGNATKGHNMETIVIIDFTEDQQKTIELAFNVEHLKDELSLNKQFNDDYDFDFDDED